MTTKKQIAANRRNAKNSTGPKTEEGKARSSQNRMTHGLLSRQVLLREEDPELFRAVQGQVWEELRPVGEVETYLAARVVAGIWRMNRVARIEASLFNDSPIREVDADAGIGKIFRLDCAHGANAFYKLCRYETTIDRGIHRALGSLRKLQAARLEREEAEWETAVLSEPPNEPVGTDGNEKFHSNPFRRPPQGETAPRAGRRRTGAPKKLRPNPLAHGVPPKAGFANRPLQTDVKEKFHSNPMERRPQGETVPRATPPTPP
jgi:hypothetical protein